MIPYLWYFHYLRATLLPGPSETPITYRAMLIRSTEYSAHSYRYAALISCGRPRLPEADDLVNIIRVSLQASLDVTQSSNIQGLGLNISIYRTVKVLRQAPLVINCGVRWVSWIFCPVRALSYLKVVTLICGSHRNAFDESCRDDRECACELEN
jgi:hypothetical protein